MYFRAFIFAIVVCGTVLVHATPLSNSGQIQLGARRCTWGPSYWCTNLTNAKSCKAVRHCIQTVWEKQEVPVDTDSICQICKDMVTQARDQLRSNETMEELKEVFEGSCNLIPVKLVRKECDKLAEDFVPELVEALSSEMNPDQVCSVAGLCNNVEIDRLMMSYYAGALDGSLQSDESESVAPSKPAEKLPVATPITSVKNDRLLTCDSCNHVSSIITDKFNTVNRDEILENILHLCGEMSSFSDACSNIVLTYFNDIYAHLKEHLSAAGICHMSGVCAGKFHQHPEDIKEESVALIADVSAGGDDIPCELCEQLVRHLRDVLVANTTESEFKLVLEGLCKQSGGFKAECLSIVDQYYEVIYNSLVNNLNEQGACFMIGVCPKGGKQFESGMMPLLPAFPPAQVKTTIRKLGANEPKYTQDEIQSMVLPIDHLIGAANPSLYVQNGELCTMCEYFLHFVQEELATPATEAEIKRSVNGLCNKLPNSVRGQCHDFIDMYSDAIIALLIQGLDPRDICPKLAVCPKHENHDDIEVFAPAPIENESDKPTCPLCLFAVKQAQEKIKNDKSKKNIKNVLDQLCAHFPDKLQAECVDFVQTYSNELVDMLVTDFKAQEICVAIKLCTNSNTYLDDMGIGLESNEDSSSSEEDFELNEIFGNDEGPIEIVFERDEAPGPNCLICEELIKTAEKHMSKKKSKAEIIQTLQNSCDKLRKNLQSKCHKYVERYGDQIADLILKETEPKIICRELGLCLWSEQEDLEIDEALKYDVVALPDTRMTLGKSDRLTGLDDIIKEPPTCVLCEFVMTKLEADLKNKKTQDEIKQAIETICSRMPKTVQQSCDKFVEQYANTILVLIGTVPPRELCLRLELCFAGLDKVVNDEVVECGVCHGASMSLLPYFKQHADQLSAVTAQDMIGVACETLPAKYYQICSEMVKIYGLSIMHLAQKPYVDQAHICAEIGKCFDNEKSASAFARISA